MDDAIGERELYVDIRPRRRSVHRWEGFPADWRVANSFGIDRRTQDFATTLGAVFIVIPISSRELCLLTIRANHVRTFESSRRVLQA